MEGKLNLKKDKRVVVNNANLLFYKWYYSLESGLPQTPHPIHLLSQMNAHSNCLNVSVQSSPNFVRNVIGADKILFNSRL